MGFQCLRFHTTTPNGFEKSMERNQSGRLSVVNNMKLDFLRGVSDPLPGAKEIFYDASPNAGGFGLDGLVSSQKFRRLLGFSPDILRCQRWTEQVSWSTHENVCTTALPALFLQWLFPIPTKCHKFAHQFLPLWALSFAHFEFQYTKLLTTCEWTLTFVAIRADNVYDWIDWAAGSASTLHGLLENVSVVYYENHCRESKQNAVLNKTGPISSLFMWSMWMTVDII